jgi:hypothetical protein
MVDPRTGRERKSHIRRNTYVSADPIFWRFGPSGGPKTAFSLAPEGVEGSNVKMGKTILYSVFIVLAPR